MYRVRVSQEAKSHLRHMTRRREVAALAAAAELTTTPTSQTANRKPMAPNPLLATWELRSGDVRVYYDVDEEAGIVEVLAFGVKVRERVRVGGVTVQLRER